MIKGRKNEVSPFLLINESAEREIERTPRGMIRPRVIGALTHCGNYRGPRGGCLSAWIRSPGGSENKNRGKPAKKEIKIRWKAEVLSSVQQILSEAPVPSHPGIFTFLARNWQSAAYPRLSLAGWVPTLLSDQDRRPLSFTGDDNHHQLIRPLSGAMGKAWMVWEKVQMDSLGLSGDVPM